MDIITKRPENMSFKEYRRKRKEFTNWQRKIRKHGILVYLASQITETEFGDGKDKKKVKQYRTFMPAIVSHYDKAKQAVYKPMEKVELK